MAAFESSELVFDTFGVAGSCGGTWASSLECVGVDVDEAVPAEAAAVAAEAVAVAAAAVAAAPPAAADVAPAATAAVVAVAAVGGGGAGGSGGCSASDAQRFVVEMAAAAPPR